MKKWLFLTMLVLCVVSVSLPADVFAAGQATKDLTTTMSEEVEETQKQESTPSDNETIPATESETAQSTLLSDDEPKSGTCGENVKWEFENGTLVISGNGSMKSGTKAHRWVGSTESIKAIIIQDGVTSISNSVFSNLNNLTYVAIPNSVTEIGDGAFYSCGRLTYITIPNGVTKIGKRAFRECRSLTNIIIPSSVTEIGERAFWQCKNLIDVIIQNGVIDIGDHAFNGCNLTSVIIPSSVTNIRVNPFVGCANLTEITVESGNENYISEDGVLFDKKKTRLIVCPVQKSGSYNIPDNVTNIGDYAFYDCENITDVIIPDNVTNIGDYAFCGCENITDVIMPDSVKDIGQYAFSSCGNLRSIIFSNGMTKIRGRTLDACWKLRCVYIPNSIISIGEERAEAFRGGPNLTVFYGGNQDEWKSIRLYGNNAPLANASNIIYNHTKRIDYKIYCGDGYPNSYEGFDHSLEMCIYKTRSDEYNPQLAHMLIAMCNSVYKMTDMTETFRDLGFWNSQSSYTVTGGIMLAYGMAKKQVGDRTLVLVTARGTDGMPWNDPIEWASNIHALTNDKKQHTGFADAANALYDRMTSFLGTTDFSNVDFVLTGFSRGAAATNILAARLITDEKVSRYNVYTYAFACPDTIKEYAYSSSYDSIFNIANANDFVSWIPRQILKSGWNKYGMSYWYNENWDDFENLEVGMTAHNQVKYLSYLTIVPQIF